MTAPRDLRRVIAETRATIEEFREYIEHATVCSNPKHSTLMPGELLAAAMAPVVMTVVEGAEAGIDVYTEDQLEVFITLLEPINAIRSAIASSDPDPTTHEGRTL